MTTKRKLYAPNDYALAFLHDRGPFTLRFRKEHKYFGEWCEVYKGSKR